MALKGNVPIDFIQGESYKYSIEFDTAQLTDSIYKCFFTCKKLDIEEEMTRCTGEQERKYTIEFLPEQTIKFPECVTTYDIAVCFNDGRVEIQSGVPFEVKQRYNPFKTIEELGGGGVWL